MRKTEAYGDTRLREAPPIIPGVEDRFHYTIADGCIRCGACAAACPARAITDRDGTYVIDPRACIDCGTCSAVCAVGAARSVPLLRESFSPKEMDPSRCYFNPGCTISVYKPEAAEQMLALLKGHFPEIKRHLPCCQHEPALPPGSTIINNCAGCDRRFRSLYKGIRTISFWEAADSIQDLTLPDYGGRKMSVHDSCGYRHKPQVHRAVRNLLRKMNIDVVETAFHGTQSVCCGDNLYGIAADSAVQERIRMRAKQFPCQEVVVYCLGCDRSLTEAGKKARYLPDLLLGRPWEPNTDGLREYHQRVSTYREAH